MNHTKVINELNSKYPGKAIIKNDENNPTEILCEVEPSLTHPKYSLAVSVIDISVPHQHKKTVETYKVIKGKLTLHVGEKTVTLNEGDSYEIPLKTIHWAEGHETWVECKSHPGWTSEDYIKV
jgi:mannose-6-phosphate isomerase-like protein (cupin superfamily)